MSVGLFFSFLFYAGVPRLYLFSFLDITVSATYRFIFSPSLFRDGPTELPKCVRIREVRGQRGLQAVAGLGGGRGDADAGHQRRPQGAGRGAGAWVGEAGPWGGGGVCAWAVGKWGCFPVAQRRAFFLSFFLGRGSL